MSFEAGETIVVTVLESFAETDYLPHEWQIVVMSSLQPTTIDIYTGPAALNYDIAIITIVCSLVGIICLGFLCWFCRKTGAICSSDTDDDEDDKFITVK